MSTLDPRYGGPVEGMIRQTQVFDRMGVETLVATLDPPDAPWLRGCAIHNVPLGLGGAWRRRLRKIVPWMRYGYTPRFAPWLRRNAAGFDVVMVQNLWSYVGLGARRALAGGATPYVVLPHGSLDPWFRETYPAKHFAKSLFWTFSIGPLINNAAATLFTTEEERRLAEGMFRPYAPRARVMAYGTADPPACSAEAIRSFRARLPSLDERPYLLFLSRLHPKKGCDLLVRAFLKSASAHPDVDLVMAGPDQIGWRAELETMTLQAGFANRIHWAGMVEGEAKWAAYHGCEAFILPSHSENFGIVVAEALACGKPVLISDKVNIWREVEADGAGLVEPDTQAGTDRLIERFLALPAEQRAVIGGNARDSFLRRFDIERNAQDLLTTLRSINEAPGTPA